MVLGLRGGCYEQPKSNLNEGLRYSLVPGDGRKPLSDKYSERGGVNDSN